MNNKKNFLKVDTYINNMSTIGEIDSFYPQYIIYICRYISMSGSLEKSIFRPRICNYEGY